MSDDIESAAEYWQREARVASEKAENYRASTEYYRAELAKAHALLGRVVHQCSERWDSMRITEHFPTDNLHGRRDPSNPKGERR